MGRGGYLADALSCAGILKIIETLLLFVTIIIHRHGDNGRYLFFATAMEQIQYVSWNQNHVLISIIIFQYNSYQSILYGLCDS